MTFLGNAFKRHFLLNVGVDIIDGVDCQRIINGEHLAMRLGDIAREQKKHFHDIGVCQCAMEGRIQGPGFAAQALHAAQQLRRARAQKVGAALVSHVTDEGELLRHMRVDIQKILGINVRLKKTTRDFRAHGEPVNGVREDDAQLAGVDRQRFVVSHKVTAAVQDKGNLYGFMAVRTERVAGRQLALKRIMYN